MPTGLQKIPYGLSNFKQVRRGHYLYIDKSAYIELLEEHSPFTILLRPRRFGKSLFLSMLWHYYDQRYAADFKDLFDGLYIGKQPTTLKNSYQILFFDFSAINTTDKSIDAIEQRFNSKVAIACEHFLHAYAYPKEAVEHLRQQHRTII